MKKFQFFLINFLTFLAQAQTPGDVAQDFGATPGFNNYVTAITTQSDGKILVGGAFSTYQGVNGNRIIRLNADGSKDTTFNIGIGFTGPSHVSTITTQSDGKILVGGYFSSYQGATENRIIRLNADGSKDTTFNSGIGFNNVSVRSITIQSDGKILVGGDFTTYQGTTENRIIRLNADGSKDTTFNSGTGFGNTVNTITTQSDGKILVGGNFTTYQGTTENRIIRLNADGSKDTAFNSGTGFGNTVNAITIQNDGKILVGGNFTTYQGTTENRIIRLNSDGSEDTSFNTGTGFGNTVNVITIQSDGKILVGGNFFSYQGVFVNNFLIRLNPDGSKDTSFITGIGFSNDGGGDVRSITTQNDGKILVGGDFTSYQGTRENRIIRLNADGSEETTFNTGRGFEGSVYSIATQTDGKILVGGSLRSYQGVIGASIFRLNTDGTLDTSFISGTGIGGTVYSITIQSDGKILVGGDFISYQGITENRIIRLNADGSKDTTFNSGIGFNDYVTAIATQSNGKILVGGVFNSYQGATENFIIRLNADGSKDTTFNSGTGFNNGVSSITIQSDGKILVGGFSTSYQGTTENRIIRLNADGSKDTSFNIGTGFNDGVYSITIQSDGKILVGGYFTSYQGTTENKIIRLNADGSKDTTFNSGTGFNNNYVNVITTQNNGKILVGGDFTTYQGTTENGIIRLNADGSKDTSFNTGTGFDGGSVEAITIQNDGKILVGGAIRIYKGNNSWGLIGLHSEESLNVANFDNYNSILLYPNPVTNNLHIYAENLTRLKNIKIYDLFGKLILEDKSNTIDVSNLSKGLYIAKVETEEGEFSKKFIKE